MSKIQWRHEEKYLLSLNEMVRANTVLRTLMQLDKHVSLDGCYHIRSIYFDDYYDTCFMENEQGVSPRKKWRIRIYDCSNSYISLECKYKNKGMTAKDSCSISFEEARILIQGHPIWSDRSLLNQFSVDLEERLFRPKIIVGYDRRPYVESLGNTRITFDCNIYSSVDFNNFYSNRIGRRCFMPLGVNLMEVKYDQFLPAHIVNAIGLDNMHQDTFSKYYLARKYSL